MSVLTDLGQLLVDQGVGVLWTDIFLGGRPKTPDTCVVLQTYLGDPSSLHDANMQPHDVRLNVQVLARGPERRQDIAEQRAQAAFAAITFRHYETGGVRYAWAVPVQAPAYVGVDEIGRPLVSFNLRLRRHGPL